MVESTCERSFESCARALSSCFRLAGSLSQRLWPEGCGSGTMTGLLPNVLPTLASSVPGPRKRAIDICPTRMSTCGSSSSSSASSQCAQLATAAGTGRRSPVPVRLRPGKQRINDAMYVNRRNSSADSKPARSIQRSSSLPARPENGRRDSRSTGPGAWPTSRNFAPHSPEKVGVASAMMPWSAHTVHRRQAAWWAANAARVAAVKFPVTCHAMTAPTNEQVLDVLSQIHDPDLGRDVVSLGMIKELAVDPAGRVSFTFELTTPACPVRDRFKWKPQDAVGALPGVTAVDVRMTANVRPAFMRPKPSEILPGVKQTIAVASGKGGVGKSTVAVNLAAALSK